MVLDLQSMTGLEADPELCLEMEEWIPLTLFEENVGYLREGFGF